MIATPIEFLKEELKPYTDIMTVAEIEKAPLDAFKKYAKYFEDDYFFWLMMINTMAKPQLILFCLGRRTHAYYLLEYMTEFFWQGKPFCLSVKETIENLKERYKNKRGFSVSTITNWRKKLVDIGYVFSEKKGKTAYFYPTSTFILLVQYTVKKVLSSPSLVELLKISLGDNIAFEACCTAQQKEERKRIFDGIFN